MVNYYKILKVSPKASAAEIKSAYRRLARKMHPDVNNSTPKASADFAIVARAYEILSNPDERAFFDRQLAKSNGSNHSTGSVFYSDNAHAQKLRQMAIEQRYNKIVDQMIEAERKESLALQKIIFPTVALFVSTFAVAIFRPTFWSGSAIFGKIILLTLFTIGMLRLIKTFREGFARYTYKEESLYDSVLQENESVSKSFSRFAAISFLVIGLIISLILGMLIGNYWVMSLATTIPANHRFIS
jgi:curved DNA-binding protein CbpA